MSAIRAVGLLSGGLDSALAARLLIDQGIEVIGLHLESPTACRNDVRDVARDLGIRLVTRAKGEEYLRLLRHPRHGYGRHLNPCVDCRRFMFQLGQPYLEEFDARFLFTGEVVGQRPMSQHRAAFQLIDRTSELEGWILRPLSARLLPETEPEKRGWVDRAKLGAIRGRGRAAQLAMAEAFGLAHYTAPGGGCLLTDREFSAKLSDLFAHVPEDETTLDDVELLRVGRHVRIGERLKIVLGRNAGENAALAGFADGRRWVLEPDDFSGPTALVCGPRDDDSVAHAARLVARYARDPGAGRHVRWRDGDAVRVRSLDHGDDTLKDFNGTHIA